MNNGYPMPGQLRYALSPADERAIGELAERVGQDAPAVRERFAERLTDPRSPGWQRYVKGVYNQPKTWWIGIIQIQMLQGFWGRRLRAQASIRQSLLSQVIHELTREDHREETQRLIEQVVEYNLRYRAADVLGRFHGGFFTNYASMGGRAGTGVSRGLKWGVRLTNFSIASFGAAVQAVGHHQASSKAVLHAIIRGEADAQSVVLSSAPGSSEVEGVDELAQAVATEVYAVEAINAMSPAPVPMREFCERRENRGLEGICR